MSKYLPFTLPVLFQLAYHENCYGDEYEESLCNNFKRYFGFLQFIYYTF
jgi:hypothetical protein